MAAGRPKKPSALKVIEGRAKSIPFTEPRPNPSMPQCPEWLMEDAKDEWERVAPELHKIGLLTQIDKTALAGYCQSYAKWKAAEENIKENGMVLKILNEDGSLRYSQQTPEFTIAIQCLKEIRAFCTMFGLDPSSRGKLELPANKDNDDFASRLRAKIG